MIKVLHEALRVLPELLAHAQWQSLDVTYHEPHVERLWIQWGRYRILLHRIWPCSSDPLYHPHRWPSAILIVNGQYEMRVGTEGHEAANLVLPAGSIYEMLDPYAWHAVRPIGGPSDSIMVIDQPYALPQAPLVVPRTKQGPLSVERATTLLAEWSNAAAGLVDLWPSQFSVLSHGAFSG